MLGGFNLLLNCLVVYMLKGDQVIHRFVIAGRPVWADYCCLCLDSCRSLLSVKMAKISLFLHEYFRPLICSNLSMIVVVK